MSQEHRPGHRLEIVLHYDEAMGAEGAQVEDVEVRRVEAESKLKKGKAMVEQQKKELHKTEC